MGDIRLSLTRVLTVEHFECLPSLIAWLDSLETMMVELMVFGTCAWTSSGDVVWEMCASFDSTVIDVNISGVAKRRYTLDASGQMKVLGRNFHLDIW